MLARAPLPHKMWVQLPLAAGVGPCQANPMLSPCVVQHESILTRSACPLPLASHPLCSEFSDSEDSGTTTRRGGKGPRLQPAIAATTQQQAQAQRPSKALAAAGVKRPAAAAGIRGPQLPAKLRCDE